MPAAQDDVLTRPAGAALPPEQAQLQIPPLGQRARRQRMLAAVVLLLAAGGGLAMYLTRSKPVLELYRSVEVTRQAIVQTVEATGHLDARERIEVSAKVAGHIAQIDVRPGDTVRRGQLLAKLDDRASELGVRSAGAVVQASVWRVAEARTNQENAQSELERVQRLAGRGLASDADVSAARAASDRAQALLKAASAEQSGARDNLAVAKFGHNLGDIVAPIDGIVLVGPENPGIPVAPERGPVFIVAAPLEQMRIEADVSEADIGDLRVGQQASFEVQTFPGRRFTARVERIGLEPRRDGGVITYPVLLAAANPDRVLLPGMTASVRIEIASAEDVLAVREAALRFTPADAPEAPARSRLWLHRGPSQLEAVEVEAGLSDGAHTEIKPRSPGAIDAGTRVAVGLIAGPGGNREQPGISLGTKK